MKNTITDSLIFCFLPPASLTQAVRNFAKGLEGWLVNSLDQIPKKMADVKVSIIANPCFALQVFHLLLNALVDLIYCLCLTGINL